MALEANALLAPERLAAVDGPGRQLPQVVLHQPVSVYEMIRPLIMPRNWSEHAIGVVKTNAEAAGSDRIRAAKPNGAAVRCAWCYARRTSLHSYRARN